MGHSLLDQPMTLLHRSAAASVARGVEVEATSEEVEDLSTTVICNETDRHHVGGKTDHQNDVMTEDSTETIDGLSGMIAIVT